MKYITPEGYKNYRVGKPNSKSYDKLPKKMASADDVDNTYFHKSAELDRAPQRFMRRHGEGLCV